MHKAATNRENQATTVRPVHKGATTKAATQRTNKPRSDNQGTSESIPTRRPKGSVNLPMPHARRLPLTVARHYGGAAPFATRSPRGRRSRFHLGRHSGNQPAPKGRTANLLSYTPRITPVAANERPVHTLSCSTETHFFIGFPMSINNTSTITHGRNVQRRRCEKTNAWK